MLNGCVIIISMVEYHYHDAEPVLKYILVTIGSSFILVLTLLLCGKKENKSNITSSPPSSYVRPESIRPIVHEETVESVEEATVESVPEDTNAVTRRGSCPTTAILPNTKQPLRKVLSSVETKTEKNENSMDIVNEGSHPYDTVSKNKNAPPIFECSGNSDSGNSIYAKVKDVPVREETAYAVVDIKDKDYDFVNGKLIRRNIENVNVEAEHSFSEFTHYDKPNCVAKIDIGEETENSGASGIYECVTDNNKEDNLEHLTTKSENDSDLYDLCGPAVVTNHGDISPRGNRGIDITDKITNTVPSNDEDIVMYDSFKGQLNPQSNNTIPRRGSSREKIDESNKSDKDEHEKQTRLSRYLKFTQSSKKNKKTEENYDVDIPTYHVSNKDISVNNMDPNEDKAPPPPSYIKLKHISAHRRGQNSITDKSYSPEPSLSGSSPTSSINNQLPFTYDDRKASTETGICHTQDELHIPHHRSRMSDGCIHVHDLPGETSLKTQYSLPGVRTQVVCETTVDNKNLANHVHLVLEKSIDTNDINSEATRGSLISEPDYAEIESRSDSSPPASSPPVIVSDGLCEITKSYIDSGYGNGPLELVGDGTYDVTKGYAVVDFNKKNEDRRIRNLYAAVDFSAKKPRDVDVTEDDPSSVKYEGTYDVIPDNTSPTIPQEELYEELTARSN